MNNNAAIIFKTRAAKDGPRFLWMTAQLNGYKELRVFTFPLCMDEPLPFIV